jgi:uncharacterized protein YecE (DUF72 family)
MTTVNLIFKHTVKNKMKPAKIHIGTSGWSYGSWRESFYPAGLKSAEFLTYYGQTFSCTEVNSSFYHLPRTTTVEGWAKKVSRQFKFCPKMSRYITHIKRLKEPEEPLEKFMDLFKIIKKSLGPILIQLPPSLKFDIKTIADFYHILQNEYADYRFAVEGRHESWLSRESLKLMENHNIAFVISQSGVGFPYAEKVTAKHIYLRFHGPGELFKSRYTTAMLEYYANKIIAWKRADHDIWVFFNNTYYIDGVENALELMQIIE